MSDWETLRRRIAISGRVLDAEMGTAVANVCVQITNAPEQFIGQVRRRAKRPDVPLPDRAMTRADGSFYFLDLPDGAYTLTAWMPGHRHSYDPAYRESSVNRDAHGHIQTTLLHITLPAYSGAAVSPPPALVTPSATAFAPTDIAGCQLWLDATALATLADGEPIATWPDKSGRNHQATQMAILNQPVYRARGLHGRDAVVFNGESHYFTLPLAETATEHTFFFVLENLPGGSHSHYLFDARSGRLALNAADTATPANVRFSDGTWRTLASAVTGSQLLTWRFADETGELFRNGQRLGTAVYTPRPIGGLVTLGAGYQRRRSYFAGAIAVFLYYDRPLFGDERQAVETFLRGRYQL